MLLDRNDWRKFKEKYGVPDAVCSFSMGEKLEAWKKKDEAAQNAKDFKARVVAIDVLLKDMKTYRAALGKTKPAKFKGKNPAEQAKSLKDAQDGFKKELGVMESVRDNYNRLANPMTELQSQVKAAKAKLQTIAKDDMASLAHFYAQQIRNDVGLPVRQVAKMNSDPKIKVALEAYEKQGNEINKLVNSTKTQDPAKVWAGCQLALTGLAFAIGAN